MTNRVKSLKEQIAEIWNRRIDVCIECGGFCCKEGSAKPGHYVEEEYKFLDLNVQESIKKAPHGCAPCPFFIGDSGCMYDAKNRSAVCVEYGCDLLRSHFSSSDLLKIEGLSSELQQELKRNR